MVKQSENDLNEIKQLTGRENAIAKFNKNSTRKMSVANQRKAENENLALLLKKNFVVCDMASSTKTNAFGKVLYLLLFGILLDILIIEDLINFGL